MNVDHSRLDEVRAGQGEIANHVIDEYVTGRISRRDLIRRGTVVGLSMPALGAIIAACGGSSPSTGGGGTGGGANATIRAGINAPSGEINPVTVDDQGGLDMLGQAGEYLTLSTQTLTLKPVLAESWKANSAADVWTFKLRKGVKFHNGQPMTADDVVYTYKLMTDPKKGSNALSAFGGGLLPDGVKKVDDYTVEFHLTAPDGNFPYLTSSDNYNMIIIPNNYDPAKWQSSFLGTGPFTLKSFYPQAGRLVRPQQELLGHEGASRPPPSSRSTRPRRR